MNYFIVFVMFVFPTLLFTMDHPLKEIVVSPCGDPTVIKGQIKQAVQEVASKDNSLVKSELKFELMGLIAKRLDPPKEEKKCNCWPKCCSNRVEQSDDDLQEIFQVLSEHEGSAEAAQDVIYAWMIKQILDDRRERIESEKSERKQKLFSFVVNGLQFLIEIGGAVYIAYTSLASQSE